MVGLITNDDETAYREEVRDLLLMWCQDNNLSLNVSKTKKLIVHYRKHICHTDNQHGCPSGVCVLSPLLYILFTHDCVVTHDSKTIIKFADDSTVAGLITNIGRWSDLAVWCQDNNLSLNVSKTKEQIVDYRIWRGKHAPIHIDRL